MKNRLSNIALAIIATFIVFPSILFADQCSECAQRKQNLCADECKLVRKNAILKCQTDCVRDYCKHYCGEDFNEYNKFFTSSCNDCLEKQFNLCEPTCPTGTDRSRALCKLNCSEERCGDLCKDKSPTTN